MARFNRLTVYNTVLEDGLVPLFYTPDLDTAKGVAKALDAGGARLLEFTNRGDYAIEVFRELVKYCAVEHPNLIIGVGSVEDPHTAAHFIAYGANFVVAPTLNVEVAKTCNRRKIGYIPGCGSVTEIATAEEYGAEFVKVFPATALNGKEFVKAVLGPRPWTRMLPTGGVTPDNLTEWFTAGVAAVGMGSKLIPKDRLAVSDFDAIHEMVTSTLDRIKRIRSN